MRHISLLFVGLVSTFLIAGCTADPDTSSFHRGQTAANSKAAGGGSAASHGSSTDDSTPQQQAPSTPTGTPAPATPSAPATPLKTGVCENPTCTKTNGAWTCLAKDSTNTPVEMDCQRGVCTCFTGDEGTTQVNDDIKTEADARTLYFANCQCL